MEPGYTDIRYFIEVANTLNLSRAAERLGIRQPSLTVSVRRLEDAVGAKLLVRSRVGVRLTRAGASFLARARNLLESWQSLKDITIRAEQEIGGKYSIGCHPALAMYILPRFMSSLLDENPELDIVVRHEVSRRIVEEVLSLRLDFGIVVNPVMNPNLVIKDLGHDEMTFWHGERFRALAPPAWESVRLVCDPDLAQTQELFRMLEKRKISFKHLVVSRDLEVIAALVASGVGIGILPFRAATRIKEQKLQKLADFPSVRDRICLIYRYDAQSSPASRRLARFIESHAKF